MLIIKCIVGFIIVGYALAVLIGWTNTMWEDS